MVNTKSKARPGISALLTPSGHTADAIQTANALADFYNDIFSPKDTQHIINAMPHTPNAVISLNQ